MIKDLEFLFKNLFFSEKFLLEKRLKRAIKKSYEKELSIISSFKNPKKDAVDVAYIEGFIVISYPKNLNTYIHLSLIHWSIHI